MISQQFVDMLRCPSNGARLALADAAMVSRFNQAIAAGTLCNAAGRRLTRALDGALLREDGAVAYQIVDEVPILLIDEGIPMAQLGAGSAATTPIAPDSPLG